MKDFKNFQYKFRNYVNHLNSQKHSSNNMAFVDHNMNIRKLCDDMESFYSLYSDFYVNESNYLTNALNFDYNKYEKWLLDD